MSLEKKELKTQSVVSIKEAALIKNITKIIESRKNRAGAFANREVMCQFWHGGTYILLNFKTSRMGCCICRRALYANIRRMV